MIYILLSNEEFVNLGDGKEVCCSVNGTEFTLMLEHAYEDTYLKKENNDG
jgi:hypothetical protein